MAPPKPTPKTSTSPIADQPSGTPMDQSRPLTPDDVLNPGGHSKLMISLNKPLFISTSYYSLLAGSNPAHPSGEELPQLVMETNW
uniref:Uncharacterized protein n=1 Tax=Caenorhabditis japonica TaxID=281687 RepID=A0A8R1ETE7_CAEJA